jgi:hypothetical protein
MKQRHKKINSLHKSKDVFMSIRERIEERETRKEKREYMIRKLNRKDF